MYKRKFKEGKSIDFADELLSISNLINSYANQLTFIDDYSDRHKKRIKWAFDLVKIIQKELNQEKEFLHQKYMVDPD
jgi:hypothetical protein